MFLLCAFQATLALVIGVFTLLLRDRRSPHARAMPAGLFIAASVYAFVDSLGYVASISVETRSLLAGFAVTVGALFILGSVRQVALAGRLHAQWEYRVIQAGLSVSALLGLVPGATYGTTVIPRHIALVNATYFDASPTVLGYVVFGICLGALLVVLGRSIIACRRGAPLAKFHVIGFGALSFAILADLAVTFDLSPLPYLLPEGILICGLAFSAAVIKQISEDRRALEELRTELEARVAARTSELEERSDELARAERLATVGRLASGIAHELNNPTAAIKASLDDARVELSRQKANPELRACIDISLAAVDRVTRIVRQLGAMAGDAAASENVRMGASLVGAVRLAAATVHESAQPSVQLRTELDPSIYVRGMAAALEEAVTAIVLNAVEAVPDGREGRVDISSRLEDGMVSLSIRDNGVGMPEAVAARAFEPFFTTKELGRSSGLGLPVAKGLVETMGGSIALRSILGVGTEVTMRFRLGEAPELSSPTRLPANRVFERRTPPGAEPPPYVRSTAPRESASASAAPSAGTVPPVPATDAPKPAAVGQRRTRVLIVDDDDLVRTAMKRYLGKKFDVDIAASVSEGLSMASRDWDIILSDVVMPDGGGQRLYLELMERDTVLAERMIFMTGGAFRSDLQEFLREQGQPVLNKPIRLSELTEAIARLGVPTE